MIQMSEEFGEVVKRSHKTAARVMVTVQGEIVEDTFYNRSNLQLIAEGSNIEYDSEQESRTTASLHFLTDTADGREMLDPLTNAEFLPYLGVEVDGDWEWCPMGVLTATDINGESIGSKGKFELSCSDRSDTVNANIWQAPFKVASGGDYFSAIRAVVSNRFPAAEFNLPAPTSSLVTPSLLFSDTDAPFTAAYKLGEAEGTDIFFDRYGVLKGQRLVDPLLEPPTVALGASQYNIVIRPVTKAVSRAEVYTGVICSSEAPWLLFPVRATIWDDDPLSRTWRGGRLGERPYKMTDALATTEAQCGVMAQAKFNKIKGVSEEISLGMLRDPRIEVTDTFEFYNNSLDASGFYSAKALSYDMGNGAMNSRMRRRR